MDQFKGKMNQQKGKLHHQYGKMQNLKSDAKGMFNKGPNQQAVSPYGMGTQDSGPNQPYGNMGMQQGQMQQPMQMKPDMHKQNMFDMCQRHHLYLVQAETVDGQLFEGIVDEYDEDGVTLLIPCGDMDDDRGDDYGYGAGPYGYGFGQGFGAPYGYGYPRRFRRFRRFRYPFFNLSRIFFPFFY
ncbi:hypothetical protein [Aquisalibacillus elongatus]|uniref:Uncharacterized protein n=1 Tax=Aquisalibacillus elongatus TaxID=485577 RepID=A0A3N5BEY3_9BACI|nr:hypothetical protein [Aquisalibacillus elongatus]RPF53870.1 hypothetical protein EDC24_1053 [Aquisalibacillus elongatus]